MTNNTYAFEYDSDDKWSDDDLLHERSPARRKEKSRQSISMNRMKMLKILFAVETSSSRLLIFVIFCGSLIVRINYDNFASYCTSLFQNFNRRDSLGGMFGAFNDAFHIL